MLVPERCVKMVAVGDLVTAPWNPREISRERFSNLKKSLESDPEFMQQRPILATPDGTVYGGNMRYRAAVDLGWAEVPVIIDDIPEKLARERALRDNGSWGEYDDQLLGELLSSMRDEGSDIDILGFEQKRIDEILNGVGITTHPGEIVISPEVLERQDYLVFVFDNEVNWRAICERFGVSTVYEQNPEEVRAGAQSANTGVGRVLRGAALLKLLDGGKLGPHEAYIGD